MAEKLLTTSIAAPGFLGLNTQDSSVSLESGYATVANNCVIDKFGRIGARNGWEPLHTSNADLNTAKVKSIGELIDNSGNSYILFAGNNKLFKISGSTVTTLSYGGGGTAPTISADHWQMAPLNGKMYLYQSGHDPLVFDPAVSTSQYKRISEVSGYNGTVQNANCVVSAYGRTWTANTSSDKNTVQFSDLLSGHVFSGGTSGTLNVAQVWPNGADEIQALAVHNNYLYIFGKRQILIYSGANDTQNLTLADTIGGVGCFARDSVIVTGGDILFASDSGIRSIARTIQEKSAPLNDISASVRDDIVSEILAENPEDVKAVYSDKDAFYLISLPSRGLVYCFDMRAALQNGARRVTTWDGLVPFAFKYTRSKALLVGKEGYVGEYTGHLDNNQTYLLKYYTNYFDFGSPTTLKMLKKVGVTVIGGQGYAVILKFGFDYSDILNSRNFSLANAAVAEYNISEYNIAEFGGSAFDNKIINVGGSGKVLQLGFETIVNNKAISIQKLDVYVKPGRTA